MAEGILEYRGVPSLMTMERTRGASALGDKYLEDRKNAQRSLGDDGAGESYRRPPSSKTVSRDLNRAERTGGGEEGASKTDMSGPTHTSADVRAIDDALSFSNKFGQKVAEKVPTVAAAFLAPVALPAVAALTTAYQGFRMGLGAIAATMESFESGVLGDITDSREAERARDTAETLGHYSREQTAAGYASDTQGVLGSGFSGYGPGLSSNFGVGLDPGLSDMDTFGDVSLGDISFGDTGGSGDDGGGLDPGSDTGGITGSIGETGTTSLGNMSASLGTNAGTGGWGGFGDGGGGDSDGGNGSGMGGSGGGDADSGAGGGTGSGDSGDNDGHGE